MNFKGESRFDAALVADAGANPASSKFAGVIEGSMGSLAVKREQSRLSDLSPSSNLVGCATVRKDVVALKADSVCAPLFPRGPLETCTLHDQKLLVSPKGRFGNAVILVGRIPRKGNPRRATMQCVATQHLARKKEGQPHPTNSFCQSVPNPPMNVGDWATIGRAANHAGQHSNRATTVLWIAGSGGGKGLWPVVALKQTPPHYRRNPINPYVEKEARLRPQHLFTFGGGDCSFAQCKRRLQRLGG